MVAECTNYRAPDLLFPLPGRAPRVGPLRRASEGRRSGGRRRSDVVRASRQQGGRLQRCLVRPPADTSAVARTTPHELRICAERGGTPSGDGCSRSSRTILGQHVRVTGIAPRARGGVPLLIPRRPHRPQPIVQRRTAPALISLLLAHYDAAGRAPSQRALRNKQLAVRVARVHEDNYGVHGARRSGWRSTGRASRSPAARPND